LSGAQALREQVREMLLERELPVTLDGARVEEVVQAAARDKKRIGEKLPFVLLEAPGETKIGCAVSDEELHAAVAELAER
jgi:3-dehydroquinate synthetase